MENFLKLKSKFPVLEKFWDLAVTEDFDPMVILAKRINEPVKVNVLIESKHLINIWKEYRSEQDDIFLEQVMLFEQLNLNANLTLVDISSLVEPNSSVRFYQGTKDWQNSNYTNSIWPVNADFQFGLHQMIGLGVYSDKENFYKYYVSVRPRVSKKFSYLNNSLIDDTCEEINLGMPDQQTLEEFDLLNAGLDITEINSGQRIDKTARYLVFR